jgi:ketosteroid isomerase-like protein
MKETTMNQSVDAKSIVRRYVAAVEAGDQQAIREVFAEDAVWTLQAGQLPISGTWKSRDTIMGEFLASALAYYEPGTVQLEITTMIAEHNEVVMQWTSRARTRQGRPYENGCIGVFTIRDGKMAAVREYMDTLYASTVFTATDELSHATVATR